MLHRVCSGVCRALLLSMWVGVMGACEDEPAPLPVVAQVPQFELRDQRGELIKASDLRGHVWIANFIFTSCPDVCPLLTQKMSELRTGLVRKGLVEGGAVRFVSFSIDPATDTPEVLLKYAQEREAHHPDWFFLTGPNKEMERVVVRGFKQTIKADPNRADNILHGSHFVLVDRALAVRGFYRSEPDGLLSLSQDAARLAAGEAAEESGP